MDRQHIGSNTPWEHDVGYSRAVRVGPFIHVAGTTAMQDGHVVAPHDAYAQATHIFKIIGDALAQCGATFADVVRTRMYVTHIADDWPAIGRAHGEIFRDIRPAATMVEVANLIHPDLRVEIELDAYCGQ